MIPPGEPGDKGVDVISRAQVLFKPQDIRIANPEGFEICDIKCGARSQLVNANPVPASTFHLRQARSPLIFDTLQIAQDMKFVVRNTTKEPKEFAAAVLGLVIDDFDPSLLAGW